MITLISNVQIPNRIDSHSSWCVEGHRGNRVSCRRTGRKALHAVVSCIHDVPEGDDRGSESLWSKGKFTWDCSHRKWWPSEYWAEQRWNRKSRWFLRWGYRQLPLFKRVISEEDETKSGRNLCSTSWRGDLFDQRRRPFHSDQHEHPTVHWVDSVLFLHHFHRPATKRRKNECRIVVRSFTSWPAVLLEASHRVTRLLLLSET